MRLPLLLIIVLICLCTGHDASEWARRQGIYQVMTDRYAPTGGDFTRRCDIGQNTYCGGTFKGLEQNLDHIQELGFDAVWISPVVQNTADGYHGYWAKDLYQVNEHFGTKQDLLDLSAALHSRGMWLMMDIVANHMGPQVKSNFANVEQMRPFDKPEHYHPFCDIKDYGDEWQVQNCWLSGLPDLNQSAAFVHDELITWIEYMVNTYSIDGLRLDTCLEVPKTFWKEFATKAAVFTICEVDDPNPVSHKPFIGVVDATLNYPLFWMLRSILLEGLPMGWAIRNFLLVQGLSWQQMSHLGNFVDNHDQPRFLSIPGATMNRFKSALAFSYLWPGIPILYQGGEFGFDGQDDPWDREIVWPYLSPAPAQQVPIGDLPAFIKKLSAIRARLVAPSAPVVERFAVANFYCFSRGQVLGCFTHEPIAQVHYDIQNLPYTLGDRVCNIFSPEEDCIEVGLKGLAVRLNAGEPKIFVRASAAPAMFV